MVIDPHKLFSSESKTAFENGDGAALVEQRNRHLGNMLNAERSIYYVQIIYGMLIFRRTHELEPLHDDLFASVQTAQESIGGNYDQDRFREDINALRDWNIIIERMELEKLRGYRDTRRKKFRYSLQDETVSFLEWLEERLQDDIEERGTDTRNLLESVCSSLRELNRVLYHFNTDKQKEGDARRILFQLSNLDELTHAVSNDLVALNARMHGFIIKSFTISEARNIINEIDVFVQAFLRQIFTLRGEIIDLLEKIDNERAIDKIRISIKEMEAERRQTPHLIRRVADPAVVADIPGVLKGFYRENGVFDILCRRINETSINVWRKLHLNLRELERKNHRIEDLRARINEISLLPSDNVPGLFLFELISPAQHYTDPQYWDERQKASPPEPRRKSVSKDEKQLLPLSKKKKTEGPARSIEQRRLEQLKIWLHENIITSSQLSALLADGRYERYEDLTQIIELVKAGKLGHGKKLASINFILEDTAGIDYLKTAEYSMKFPSLRINKKGDSNG